MKVEQKTVSDFFSIYNTGEYEKIPLLIGEKYIDNSPAQARSPEDVVAILKLVSDIFPDLTCTVLDIFSEQELVAARVRFSGTHSGTYIDIPASGNTITWEALEYFKVENGKIVESWGYWPDYDMIKQMQG